MKVSRRRFCCEKDLEMTVCSPDPDPCLFQVGFMDDGRIVAADIQYYTNAGNTVDESILVSRSG